MTSLADSRLVGAEALPHAAEELRAGGWRLVTATCLPRPSGWTVLYHFERGERLRHLRVELGSDEAVPAIDGAYPGAFLVENEMHELQGLPVVGMSVDYEGRLFRDFDGPEGWVHVQTSGAAKSVRSPRPAGDD